MYGSLYISHECILFLMRKMIVELDPGLIVKTMQRNMLENIETFEMLELLRLDFEKGVKVLLMEIVMKPGFTLDDVKWPTKTKITVIRRDKQKYICVLSASVPRKFKKLFEKFNIDVIWTTPTGYVDGTFKISAIGEEKELKKMLKGYKLLANVNKVSYHKGVYQEHNLLSVLTDKQRDIILAAKREGYYDYPRKINTKELAAKVGISKATVVEHLRKAEGRLMANILAGY